MAFLFSAALMACKPRGKPQGKPEDSRPSATKVQPESETARAQAARTEDQSAVKQAAPDAGETSAKAAEPKEPDAAKPEPEPAGKEKEPAGVIPDPYHGLRLGMSYEAARKLFPRMAVGTGERTRSICGKLKSGDSMSARFLDDKLYAVIVKKQFPKDAKAETLQKNFESRRDVYTEKIGPPALPGRRSAVWLKGEDSKFTIRIESRYNEVIEDLRSVSVWVEAEQLERRLQREADQAWRASQGKR